MESALSNQIRPKLGEGITTATARANEQAAKWSASVTSHLTFEEILHVYLFERLWIILKICLIITELKGFYVRKNQKLLYMVLFLADFMIFETCTMICKREKNSQKWFRWIKKTSRLEACTGVHTVPLYGDKGCSRRHHMEMSISTRTWRNQCTPALASSGTKSSGKERCYSFN